MPAPAKGHNTHSEAEATAQDSEGKVAFGRQQFTAGRDAGEATHWLTDVSQGQLGTVWLISGLYLTIFLLIT